MRNLKTHSIVLVCCLLGATLYAQDLRVNARLPYSNLVGMAQVDQNDPNLKSFKMNISSSLKGVPPEKIELILDTRAQPLHLIVNDKGVFEVPWSKDLLAENPFLIANQPKGTLNISFKMVVPPFNPPKIVGGKIKYKALFQPLIELQSHVRKVDPTFGFMGKDQFALKIITDSPIRIVRVSGSGDRQIMGARTYQPINGIIYLFMEPYMFSDDPIVEIPGKVKIEIKPFPAYVAEKIKADY